MAITFMDPTAEPGVPISPYELRLDLDSEADVVVGLLANSFVDSEAFLSQIAERIAVDHPRVTFREYDKVSPKRASEVISEERAIAIKNECVAVITAYGH